MSCTGLVSGNPGVRHTPILPTQCELTSSRWLFTSDTPETVTTLQVPGGAKKAQILSRTTIPFPAGGKLQVRAFLWHLRDKGLLPRTCTLYLMAAITGGGSATLTRHVAFSDRRSDSDYAQTGACIAVAHLYNVLYPDSFITLPATLTSTKLAIAAHSMPHSSVAANDVNFAAGVHELDFSGSSGQSLRLWTAIVDTSTVIPEYSDPIAAPTMGPTEPAGTRGAWLSCKVRSTSSLQAVRTIIKPNPFQFSVSAAHPSGPEVKYYLPHNADEVKNKGLYGVDVDLLAPLRNDYLPASIDVFTDLVNDGALNYGGAVFAMDPCRGQPYQGKTDACHGSPRPEAQSFLKYWMVEPRSTALFRHRYAVGGAFDTPGAIEFNTVAIAGDTGAL